MTLEEIAQLAETFRDKGVQWGRVGDVTLVMRREAARDVLVAAHVEERGELNVPRPEVTYAPIGPDGKAMSEYDQMLYGATLGLPEEEAAE